MDFKDNPEQAAFRAEIRDWLAEHAGPLKSDGGTSSLEDRYQEAKTWYRKVADAGYACLNWPKEYGGAGLSAMHKVIWSEEVARYDVPDDFFVIGIGNCGPALMHFCSEQQKRDFLPRMASGEDVWCQLFSEPAAGSDLAGLKTRAEPGDNGDWKIKGQKIWTSGAEYSDYGVILCRSDPTVSKYRGLTMFMIDMKQAGVQVSPIRQMDGGQHFCEVFFDDAHVPDAYRLGEVGGGWQAALLVLMNERLAVTGAVPNGFAELLDFVANTEIDGRPLREDPVVRDRLAGYYAKHAGMKALYYRTLTTVAQGGIPGADGAIGKLVSGTMNQEIAEFALQLMGEAGVIRDSQQSVRQAHFQDSLMFSPGIRLAGGTDEIMRNILAEQILGLPQEPRADKGMAYCDIPTGNQ